MGNNGQGPDGELAMKIDAHRHTQDTHATDGTRRADNDAGVAPGGRLAGAGASDRVELSGDAGILTDSGMTFLAEIGIDTEPMLARRTQRSGRVLCRPCLDWSERRPHLAGALGAALCAQSMREGWTRRLDGTRAVLITRKGERIFRERFGATIG